MHRDYRETVDTGALYVASTYTDPLEEPPEFGNTGTGCPRRSSGGPLSEDIQNPSGRVPV